MPRQAPRLRLRLTTEPDPDPSGPEEPILKLIAHGLAEVALQAARAEAEAELGRPLRHAASSLSQPDPVEAMKRRVLGGD